MTQSFKRAVTGVLAVAALYGCDARRVTDSGFDGQPPSIQLSGAAPDGGVIDISSPFSVTIVAGDNISLREVALGAIVGENVFVSLDTVFTSSTPAFNRAVSVLLGNAVSGQQVKIVGYAEDGIGNFSTDTLTLTILDPGAPAVSLTQPTDGSSFRAGQPFILTATASDEAGVAKLGYQLLQIAASGLEKVFVKDSVILSDGSGSATRNFAAIVPDSLIPGSYVIRAFATDGTGNRAVSTVVAITVQDDVRPGLNVIAPRPDSNVTVGQPLLVESRLTDNAGLKRYSVLVISTTGDPDLGTVDTVVRYDSVFAPVNSGANPRQFREGLRDTTIRRLMSPKDPADTTTGVGFVIARVTDIAGNDSTVVRRVRFVSGPAVTVVRPGAGAVAAPGKSIVVELRAVDKDGVRQVGYNVSSTTFNVTRTRPQPATFSDTLFFVDTLVVPANFPAGTSFTISPFGIDNLGQPGSGTSVSVSVVAPGSDTQGPVVYQTAGSRLEVDDSVRIRAIDPSGVNYIGFQMRAEETNALIRSDSVLVGGAFTDAQLSIQLNVPATQVGKKIVLLSFATDAVGNKAWSVPAGVTISQGNVNLAKRDTSLVVYGRTFPLPNGGVAADVVVDTLPGRERAYISNLTFDRLEVWRNASATFASKTIAVGSQPWGLFIDNSSDTLLVANSGGTNLSRVFINDISANLNNVAEVPARRIKTQNSSIFDVSVAVSNGIFRYEVIVSDFSDRPQYVAQTVTNEIYFSTKPTPTAKNGTIRHYDPNFAVPDVRFVWQYGSGGGDDNVAVINADSVYAIISPLPTVSDKIVLCDHPYGTGGASVCFVNDDFNTALTALQATGSDVVGVSGLDVKSLGLTDTTFVAAGGDRRWVAFGEGNTPDKAGRVMMARDPGEFFSPGISVTDLTNNASERLFGLAINSNSTVVGARGAEAHFSDIDNPFHLRLQGKFNTFDNGAGLAFHPGNIGDVSTPDSRIAFVASANGTIEIIDSFHYTSRGVLPVRANLTGPIRVTRRFPTDDPAIILKIFGLTPEGLIVIDVRAGDIIPIP